MALILLKSDQSCSLCKTNLPEKIENWFCESLSLRNWFQNWNSNFNARNSFRVFFNKIIACNENHLVCHECWRKIFKTFRYVICPFCSKNYTRAYLTVYPFIVNPIDFHYSFILDEFVLTVNNTARRTLMEEPKDTLMNEDISPGRMKLFTNKDVHNRDVHVPFSYPHIFRICRNCNTINDDILLHNCNDIHNTYKCNSLQYYPSCEQCLNGYIVHEIDLDSNLYTCKAYCDKCRIQTYLTKNELIHYLFLKYHSTFDSLSINRFGKKIYTKFVDLN